MDCAPLPKSHSKEVEKVEVLVKFTTKGKQPEFTFVVNAAVCDKNVIGFIISENNSN